MLPLLGFLPNITGILNPIPCMAFISWHSSRSYSIYYPKSFLLPKLGPATSTSSCYLSTTIPTLYDLGSLDDGESSDDQSPYLVSPAPESYNVIDRCVHHLNHSLSRCWSAEDKMQRTSRDYYILQTFYLDMEALVQYLVKPGYMLVLFTREEKNDADVLMWNWNIAVQHGNERVVVRRCGLVAQDAGGDLSLQQQQQQQQQQHQQRRLRCRPQLFQLSSTLEIAKLAVMMSDHGHSTSNGSISRKSSRIQQQAVSLPRKMEHIICQLEKRLCLTLGSDLRGVTSADAAFYVAISGVSKSHHIFDALVKIGIHELRRLGRRSSFQPKYILQMVEKFAATGFESKYTEEMYHLAGTCLRDKGYTHGDSDVISHLLHGSFGLHSNRPLLWLWRYSARQKKVSYAVIRNDRDETSGNVENVTIKWNDYFDDTSRGLVLDIGCGFGVCLLNLWRQSKRQKNGNVLTTDDLSHMMEWSEYNFAGADLNPQLIGYANGVTSRFPPSEQKRVHFFCCSAVQLLSSLLMYKGNIELIMIHFPSPYRSTFVDRDGNTERTGNSQLPGNVQDDFMITPQVAIMISNLLQQPQNNHAMLLFQTKCEDVAIHVKNLFLSTGTIETVPCSNPVNSVEDSYTISGRRPKRLEQWLAYTPNAERAEGECWSSVSMMPTVARPETEIQCEYDHTVVHRCIFRSIQKKS